MCRIEASLQSDLYIFTKPNIEVSGWLYQTKTHITHIGYQPFLRVSPPNYCLGSCSLVYDAQTIDFWTCSSVLVGSGPSDQVK